MNSAICSSARACASHGLTRAVAPGGPVNAQGWNVSFHSLRHTSVSLLKDAGVPDSVVMALVGHENSAMSHRYTHVGKEALAKAAKTLPEL